MKVNGRSLEEGKKSENNVIVLMMDLIVRNGMDIPEIERARCGKNVYACNFVK